jgi:hypothetical protein
VKYCLRYEAIQILKVSPDSQGQGVPIHVVAEFGKEEANLSESFLGPLNLLFQ